MTHISKRILDKDVINRKGNNRSGATLRKRVIPKGTVLAIEEQDIDPSALKAFGIDPTPENLITYRAAFIAVHPDSYQDVQDPKVQLRKGTQFFKDLLDASHPVEIAMEDWVRVNWGSYSTKALSELLGKLLDAVFTSPGNIPRLLGLDDELDTLLKNKLAAGYVSRETFP